MDSVPNKEWGSKKEDRPASEKYEAAAVLPYAITADENFLETAKVELTCDDKDVQIHFTTDGSRPTKESELYTNPIVADKTTEIRFASFKDGILPSRPVSVNVKKLDFEDWKNHEGLGNFRHGLKYRYFEVHVLETEELEKFSPVETGIIPNFTIDQRKREDYFGYIWSGFLDIPRDGIYTFSVKVNDKCALYFDGREFMRGGIKTVALRKGKYEVMEKYFQLGARKFNIISWEGPGIENQEIPPTALYYKAD
jgi:hypothetical protein